MEDVRVVTNDVRQLPGGTNIRRSGKISGARNQCDLITTRVWWNMETRK